MHRWFAPPQRADAYETFAARVLHYALLLLISATLLFVAFVSYSSQIIIIPLAVGVFGGCYALLHAGQLRLASFIFVGSLWIVITVVSFAVNGILNSAMSMYTLVIIFAAVLLSNRASIVMTILTILSLVALRLGETAGVLPRQRIPLNPTDRFFQLVVLFSAAGVLLSATSRAIVRGVERIRQHEAALLERNRALEMEIAERRRTEESLRVSEAKYRLLFENIPVMAGVYGQDGEIILMNNSTARFLRGTPETLQGRNLRDIMPPDVAEVGIQTQAQVMEAGQDRITEGTIRLMDGREMYYMRHIMPLPNATGDKATQVLVLTIDITEKQQAEQRERELALAQEKNAFLSEFFSTVSHDLKTPLATMNTNLYLLQRAQTDDQREQRFESMKDLVALMDKYLQDMLAIARLEHLPTFDFQRVDLNPLVEEIVALLRPSIESRQLAHEVNVQRDLPAIRGDAEQLRRMLINLIENAVNYTPPRGHIAVKTSAVNGQVTLEVKDSGIGIEPDAIPHIFERFYRTPKAKAAQNNGTGLGLTIIKKIVDTHQATIEVCSQPDEGTTFIIHFPTAFDDSVGHTLVESPVPSR